MKGSESTGREIHMAKKVTSLDAFKEDQTEVVVDTSKKLKVAIIGTGWIAESFIAGVRLKTRPIS